MTQTQTAARADDAVRSMLLGRAREAHRLATWILHDPIAAEDAVQEAALVAWERRRELRDADAAEGWFNRILVNVCRTELRRRRRRPLVDETAPLPDPPATATGVGWEDREELTGALLRLDPDEQILLALRYGRDLTVPQIVAATGIREGTVKSRLHYALNHLRAELDAERRREEALR